MDTTSDGTATTPVLQTPDPQGSTAAPQTLPTLQTTSQNNTQPEVMHAVMDPIPQEAVSSPSEHKSGLGGIASSVLDALGGIFGKHKKNPVDNSTQGVVASSSTPHFSSPPVSAPPPDVTASPLVTSPEPQAAILPQPSSEPQLTETPPSLSTNLPPPPSPLPNTSYTPQNPQISRPSMDPSDPMPTANETNVASGVSPDSNPSDLKTTSPDSNLQPQFHSFSAPASENPSVKTTSVEQPDDKNTTFKPQE